MLHHIYLKAIELLCIAVRHKTPYDLLNGRQSAWRDVQCGGDELNRWWITTCPTLYLTMSIILPGHRQARAQ